MGLEGAGYAVTHAVRLRAQARFGFDSLPFALGTT